MYKKVLFTPHCSPRAGQGVSHLWSTFCTTYSFGIKHIIFSQPMLTPNDHPLPTRPDSLYTSALYKSFTYLLTYLIMGRQSYPIFALCLFFPYKTSKKYFTVVCTARPSGSNTAQNASFCARICLFWVLTMFPKSWESNLQKN